MADRLSGRRLVRRQMNPRQRQGLLLVVLAAVGLIGVFLLVASYVSSVSKQVGPKVDVLTLVRPLSAYQPVTSADLGVVAASPEMGARHRAERRQPGPRPDQPGSASVGNGTRSREC